jgi:Leucine-rich repeat (LRR) protein
MLKFIKDLFKKDDGSIKYYSPPAGTAIRDLNVGSVVTAADAGGYTGIRLPNVELSAKGIGKIAKAANLKGLDLSGGTIDDTALAALRGCKSLEQLNLSGTKISGACFVKIGLLPKLDTLNLSGTQCVDMTLVALRSCRSLRDLDLSGTKISDAALDYIGQLQALRRIKLENVALDGAKLQLLTHGTELKVVGI